MVVVKVKVTFTLEQAIKAHRENGGIVVLSFNLGARRGGWSASRLSPFTLAKETRLKNEIHPILEM
jgi:hypothetical protein